MRKVTQCLIERFKLSLILEEKSELTIEKYIRDVTAFKLWLCDGEFDKTIVLDYKNYLTKKYAPASVNSMISSLNSFFIFNKWFDMKIKAVRIQRQIFVSNNKELNKSEYERLLIAAQKRKNQRLYYIIQTICATGIRISELKYITVEAIKCVYTEIKCKNKIRTIILSKQLCCLLKKYIRIHNIKNGTIFISHSGNPLDRSNIWADMKKLCSAANVSKDKVFPHNLRHLFARTFYKIQKDIVHLADILGHTSVNTTRIYTSESKEVHRRQIQKLNLIIENTT